MGFMTLVPHTTHILFISNFTGTSRKNGFQSVPPHKNRPVFNSLRPKIILWILSTNHARKMFLAKVIGILQVLRWLKYYCYLAFNDITKIFQKSKCDDHCETACYLSHLNCAILSGVYCSFKCNTFQQKNTYLIVHYSLKQ